MYKINFPYKLNPQQFLKDYWQKKSLYMPQAWQSSGKQGFDNPISPEELAGLSLENDLPSRIVVKNSETDWTVENGPFTEQTFKELEGKIWSLLITDIEKHLPDFMAYVHPFRFLPDWRFDDLMISYAPTGGSVGPHIDDYDVFLIQTQGEREWQLESFKRDPANYDETIEGIDLRLLKDYQPDQTHLCKAGDILYIPPRTGHYGISQSDDCMTWSIGFKAPNFHNLMAEYMASYQEANVHKRYTDPNIQLQDNAGEILLSQTKEFKKWLLEQVSEDEESFARFFAKFISQGQGFDSEQSDVEPLFEDELLVEPNLLNKIYFITLKQQTYLYVNGDEYKVSLALAKQLTQKTQVKLQLTQAQDKKVVSQLIAQNVLVVVEQ